MTKHPPSHTGISARGNVYEPEDDDADGAGLIGNSLSFPGAQFFNEIMHEKMRPKKVAKFKVSKIPERDS